MISKIKKYFIMILTIVIILAEVVFSDTVAQGSKNNPIGHPAVENTYVYIDDYVELNDLMVIGDSYATLLSFYNVNAFNYIVHQGYTLKKIYEELLPLYSKNCKYVFLFIGGNDYMEQTNVYYFAMLLQNVINIFKSKGAKVILATYIEPQINKLIKSTNSFIPNAFYMPFMPYIPCSVYNEIIKNSALLNGLLYIDIADLYTKYGLYDHIHPGEKFLKELKERLKKTVEDDMAG